MTQTAPPEQTHKMRYPKGCRMLLVRDCTVAICNDINSGATLLSTLLFWYDHPHKFDTYQDNDFILCRTQEEIASQSCNQIDVKTIHDAAVPLLQLFGYLSIKEKMNGNIYTLHMDGILAAYAAYEGGEKKLKKFLKEALAKKQFEFSPIVMNDEQLEETLINKRYFQLELEKVLIANREISICKRGRKPKSEAVQEAETQTTETIETSRENKGKEREGVADATARSQSSSQNDLSEETEKREAVKPSTPVQEVTQGVHKQNTNTVQHPPADVKPPANKVPTPKRPRPQQQELTDELPAGAHSKPVEPHADMAWGTRKCLQWFDYWRGGVLIAKYKLQQAASCAKGLAEQFDEATVIEIRNEMAGDQYYIDRGGVDVCDVANNCHKYLNKIRTKQKPPSNEHKAASFYTLDALIERQNQWKTEGVTS